MHTCYARKFDLTIGHSFCLTRIGLYLVDKAKVIKVFALSKFNHVAEIVAKPLVGGGAFLQKKKFKFHLVINQFWIIL